jgi:hypothetical protein
VSAPKKPSTGQQAWLIRLFDDQKTEWARWQVLGPDGPLGYVYEERGQIGNRSAGSPSYVAHHNPEARPFKSLWRSSGHATPKKAMQALLEHLA